ncbi:MAG: tripartite tricarboxylate transporter substrate binding protein, partial [Burkholderiales bacterium]|nr:tripartite tricarboxylate transporter substrate binding protein [Burkholderiales bacterium]
MLSEQLKKVLLCVALAACGHALAQGYPTKPIKIVVGFAAGGSTDKLARLMALRMTELLGQSVV